MGHRLRTSRVTKRLTRWEAASSVSRHRLPYHLASHSSFDRTSGIDVVRISAPPPAGHGKTEPEKMGSAVLKALPTMSLRALRLKAAKALRAGTTGGARSRGSALARFWLRTHDGGLSELEGDRDSKELDWIGFEEGTILYVYLE